MVRLKPDPTDDRCRIQSPSSFRLKSPEGSAVKRTLVP